MAFLPSGPTVLPSTSLAARQSPEGSAMPIIGMRISAAREDTTLPTAPPTMTATARASTLFFSRNSLNPLIICELPYVRISSTAPLQAPEYCVPPHSRYGTILPRLRRRPLPAPTRRAFPPAARGRIRKNPSSPPRAGKHRTLHPPWAPRLPQRRPAPPGRHRDSP